MAANPYDVGIAAQRLAEALLDDVERIAVRSVARMQELMPSYAEMPADALIPVTLTNTRNLLEAVCDPGADRGRADDHFRHSGETRRVQGISADEMLQAWRIGLEVVREEAHPVAARLEVTDAALLEFVESTLRWGDVGMRRSASAYRQGEIRELERLAAEHAALRRVATMVAQGCSAKDVFAKVAEELSHLLDVTTVRLVRFEPDRTATLLATDETADEMLPVGTNAPLRRGGVIEQISRTGQPASVEDYSQVEGAIGDAFREEGVRGAAGAPIIVEGRLWGAVAVGSSSAWTSTDTEQRVAEFAELVSTAISNVESRAKVEELAAEQSALRRVAELVARQASPEEVFELVTDELSSLLGASQVGTVRFEEDGTATVVAARGPAPIRTPPGTNLALPPQGVLELVSRTGRPARVDEYTRVGGPIAAILREEGVQSMVGGPIVVDGRLWGAMLVAANTREPLPLGSEHRVARFAELVSAAISNVEAWARIERLAAEQSALRRVAELVARQAPSEQVFALVTEELSRLLEVNMVRTLRFEPDGTATILAARGVGDDGLTEGTNFEIPAGSGIGIVLRTGRPARVDDFAEVKGPIGAALCEHGAGAGVAGPIVVDGKLWGAMAVGARKADALPRGSEHRVAQFAELISTAISNLESRARVEQLAAEQAALRRVAEVVARQAPAEQIFAAVTDELSHVLGVDLMVRTARFEPNRTATILAAGGVPTDLLPAGSNIPCPEGSIFDRVRFTGRPGRVDDYTKVTGPVAAAVRAHGICAAAAGPIVVDGRTWGAMAILSERSLPGRIEHRVTQFAEHVSTAISNIESRAKVERLAAEQSALRRVATLVAREHSPDDLFAALVEELGVLLQVDATAILRYEADSSATVIAGWSDRTITLPVGKRLPLEGENLAGEVHRTGSPRRKEDYSGAPGAIAATVRELGIRSAVASPIVVAGTAWGVIAVLSRQPEPLPSDTEARIAEFTRQAGLAVANAKSRSDLAESRARIVRAGDEARRRFERDLHDGAQQRLVSLGLELRSAEATLPSGFGDLQGRLSRVVAGMNGVLDDLRELSRGLHPAVLSEDGLTPALSSLARRSAVPVDLRLDLGNERFDEPVEVAAYYAASEALTNTAKHAGASRVEVAATRREGWLELSVTDDGRGGADASNGSGLTGLVDRVEAIGGTMHIESTASVGTAVHVKLPIKTTQS